MSWTIRAEDEQGRTGRRQVGFGCGIYDGGYLVHTDKSVYNGGEAQPGPEQLSREAP